MTTSDKRPRRTTKSAKTAKTSKTADTSNAAQIPAAADLAPATHHLMAAPIGKTTPVVETIPVLEVASALQAAPALGKSPIGTRAGRTSKKMPESRRIKDVSVIVTPRHREDRHASIALAAYFRSESRGFAPGHEIEDWLAAEEEVDQRLLGEGRAS
jgi:hypothetical protein